MEPTPAKKGGRPRADIEQMAVRLRADLDAASLNPGLSVSKRAVCERTRIPESTLDLYAAEPRIAPLVQRRQEMQEARRAERILVTEAAQAERPAGVKSPARVTASTPSELASLDDDQIARRYAQATQKASWAAQRLGARFRRVPHVSDLPAATWHLEHAVQEMHAVLAVLRPLAEEWVRRQGGIAAPVPDQHELLDTADPIPGRAPSPALRGSGNAQAPAVAT